MLFKKSFRKIDFLIIGAQKAGTSVLHNQIKQHPGVGVGRNKELHFFDNEKIFKGGRAPRYSSYHKQFDFSSGASIFGESTPIYLYWPAAPARIWEYKKDIKLIALLRNPVERAFSHWVMEKGRNLDTIGFSEAIRTERERCKTALPDHHRIFSYVDRGFYAEQVRRYQRYFPDEQLCFIKYDKFRKNPEQTMDVIFNFLKIDPALHLFKERVINKTDYKSEIKPADRQYLIGIYQNDVQELERLLDWDCSAWLA